MSLVEIVKAGREAGKVFNKLLDKLPDHDQRAMKEYFKFKSKFKEEIARDDSDFDTLQAYKERQELLDDSFFNEVMYGKDD